jgi:hypothetical protein
MASFSGESLRSLEEPPHSSGARLFPIREFGMNSESQPLQPGEISEMKQDAKVRERLVKSYRLILDFVRAFKQSQQWSLTCSSLACS